MFTEQEAVAQLNEKIASGSIKVSTKRFLDKIKDLQSRLQAQQTELDELHARESAIKTESQRLKGAISILLELAAEDEGLLAEVSENEDKSS